MQVDLPTIGAAREPAVLLRRLVEEGGTSPWRRPLGLFANSAGRFPLFSPVRGVVRWHAALNQPTRGPVCTIEPDGMRVPPVRPIDRVGPVTAGLVVTYVGPLPGWFPLFARSLQANPWLTVYLVGPSREQIACELPDNVKPVPMTLDDVRQRARVCFGFMPALAHPYKLCDLKPTYGEVFADLLADHDWFGWGDLDLVYGRLGDLLAAELRSDAPILLSQGSCCLCRNTPEMRTLYRAEEPGVLGWRDAMKDPVNRIFDEFGALHRLCEQLNVPTLMPPVRADVCSSSHRLTLASDFSCEIDYPEQAFTWRNGRLFREFYDGDRYGRREFGFIHLQKRRMQPPSAEVLRAEHLAICPDRFELIGPEPLTREEMRRLNPSRPLRDLLWRMYRPWGRVRRLLRERALRRRYTAEPS